MSKRKKRNSFHFLKRKFSKIMQKKLVLLFSLVVLAFAIFNWKNYTDQCHEWRKIYEGRFRSAAV